MKLSEIEDRLVPWYRGSLRDGGAGVHLVSSPGLGKSDVLSLTPAKLKALDGKEYGFVVVNGATVTLVSATGYLVPRVVDGKSISEFSRPNWWMTREGKPLEAYAGGVILIDEFDKMALDEKKIFGEALLSKVVGTHKLPPGWVVWSAGNNLTDRSGSTKDFDHLINRRRTLQVTPDGVSLKRWQQTHGCLPETISFSEDNFHIVFGAPPKEQGPWCTPRSLAQADNYLQELMKHRGDGMIPVDSLTTEELKAGIGNVAADAYITTIRLGQELPEFSAVVAAPDKVIVPSKPDARRLAMYKMAGNASTADIAQVITYVSRFPPDIQLIFGKGLILRDKRMIINPHFAKWSHGRAELLALMASLK